MASQERPPSREEFLQARKAKANANTRLEKLIASAETFRVDEHYAKIADGQLGALDESGAGEDATASSVHGEVSRAELRRRANPHPWRRGNEAQIMGRGGLYDLEQRRVTIAADKFQNQVFGESSVTVKGEYREKVAGSMSVMLGKPLPDGVEDDDDDGASAVPRTGTESLTVNGNADLHIHDRTTLMTGTVTKVWTGGTIMRLAGMEGVICGGAFAKVHVGIAAHMAPLVTGDVYGGAAHAAASRAHIAGVGYRSADTSAWAIGAYIRTTQFTIQPAQMSPMQHKKSGMLAKAAKIVKVMGGLCPFIDIGVGILMAPIALVLLIAALVGRKKPPPPGPPRTLTQSIGTHNIIVASDKTT